MRTYVRMLNLPITRRKQLSELIARSTFHHYTNGVDKAPMMRRKPDYVVDVKSLPAQEVVSMQTTTGNYTAWGYASSNCFLIGDEHPYPSVKQQAVKRVFGEDIESDITTEAIIKELRERYHVFFVVPNMTSHYDDAKLYKDWIKLLDQQRVLKLDDPKKICELIATSIAITEEYIGPADVKDATLTKALRPIVLE